MAFEAQCFRVPGSERIWYMLALDGIFMLGVFTHVVNSDRRRIFLSHIPRPSLPPPPSKKF